MTNININKVDFIDFDPTLNKSIKTNIINALNYILINHKILKPTEISLKFVNKEEIKKINNQFRNKNEVTDVLSFPIFENVEEINKTPGESILLGDIFINLDRAQVQAEQIGQSLEDEVLYLSIHSILHLLGYDHMNETDKKVMRDLEKSIFAQIKNNNEIQ